MCVWVFDSGGEDCYTRIWSIKSGQLLSANKFSNTVPAVVCWSSVESTCTMDPSP